VILVSTAHARNTVAEYSIKDALSGAKAQSKLGDEVRFYFGEQVHEKVAKRFFQARTNKKTNAFGKSDERACQWVFLSAMLALRDRALLEGGNAVINIRSNYKRKLTSSDETFRCGAGALIAGVALVGDIVVLEE